MQNKFDQNQPNDKKMGVSHFNAKQNFRNLDRHRRLRDRLHVNIYVLPNLLTIMNMFFGYYAIIHSIMGEYVLSSYAIVAAAVFDMLDGRVARMTRSTSEFGAQLDSLSDLVSFCVAPGILLYLWSLQPMGRVGWLVSFFFVACGALRLARFNVQKSVVSSAFFQGLPTPMAAGIVASSVLAFNDLQWEASGSMILLSMTAMLAIVMVSTFRYRSFKDIDFKHRLPFRYLVFGVFLVAVIAMRPEVMLFVTFMTYAVLGAIFGILKIGRQPKLALNSSNNPSDDSSELDH
ncbi:MAG: CDP-diacylglycerol--serine O-phosphatidyltransferase [Bdellovibrionales bacterium]